MFLMIFLITNDLKQQNVYWQVRINITMNLLCTLPGKNGNQSLMTWNCKCHGLLLDSQKHGFTWANKDKMMVLKINNNKKQLYWPQKKYINTLTLTTLTKGYLKQAVWGPYKLLRFILCGRNQAFDRPLESCGT